METREFSVTQILREINLEKSRRSKPAGLSILGALNFDDLVYLGLQKVQILVKKAKFRDSKSAKLADV